MPSFSSPTETTRLNRSWGHGYLVRWLFGQSRVWITARGESKNIEDMTPDHVLNTLLMLERVEGDLYDGGLQTPLQSTPLYLALKRRVQDAPAKKRKKPAAPVNSRQLWDGQPRCPARSRHGFQCKHPAGRAHPLMMHAADGQFGEEIRWET